MNIPKPKPLITIEQLRKWGAPFEAAVRRLKARNPEHTGVWRAKDGKKS